MKKAINIWSFAEQDIKKCIRLAAKAGFEGIELSLDETGPVSLESSDQQLREIFIAAQDEGIKIHSVASGLYWKYSFTSNDKNERKKASEIAVRQLETAKILGADSVLIVPGAVAVDFIADREVIQYDLAYDRALRTFIDLKPFSESLKINIGIENVWNHFLLSPLELRDFIDIIDSSYIGSYLDVGNIISSGFPEHWIRILGKRIKKVHFKDYKKNPGGLNCFVDLLSGDVNWPEVMSAFKEIGYDGWCTAEMIPPYKHYPDQIIYNTSASMDRILGRN